MKTVITHKFFIYIFVSIAFLILGIIYWEKYYYFPPISFIETDDEPAVLLDEFISYSSIESVKKIFIERNIKWDLQYDVELSKDSRHPKMQIKSISTNNYTHLGVDGDLTIKFYNDRLAEIIFKPKNFDLYIDRLSKNFKIDFVNQPIQKINSKVDLIFDFTNKKIVTWREINLNNQHLLWIRRYK